MDSLRKLGTGASLKSFFSDPRKWVKKRAIKGVAMCLGYACECQYGTDDLEVTKKLAASIKKLFPLRYTPDPDKITDDTGVFSIVVFNDHEDTTFADIRAVLEDACV